MDKPLDAGTTTGGRFVPESMRRTAAVAGGVAAGLALVILATYALSTAKVTPTVSVDALLSASECETQPISIVLGQDAEATMTVTRRTRCHIAASGVSMASVEEFSIVEPPKHGIVMQRGRTGVVYQSDADYRGQDSFTFTMRGKAVDLDETLSGEQPTGAISVVRAYVTVK
ncbi:MAG TPA: hypothetical protein VKD43_16535 [Xanthobacteraceae bacterium]|nr:hypothetical protein [Xanthobacteraceae bacterium]